MRYALALVILSGFVSHGQSFNDLRVERVATGFRFTEGPVWSKQNNYLLFSDVPNNKIHKLVFGEPVALFRENSNGANGNTLDTKGNLYTCESVSRRVTRTNPKGVVEVIAEKWEGKRLNAPNDIVVRKDGILFFTDPAFGNQADARELPFYGIYRVTPKGEMGLIARWDTRPNGIALSPNGKILYVANSDERNLKAFDVDNKGMTTNERVLISGIEGVPDGIRVDAQGNIYVTCKGVAIYSPQGKLIRMIEMPETPTNVAFGEGDYKSLFVTARTSVYRVRLDVAGHVEQ